MKTKQQPANHIPTPAQVKSVRWVRPEAVTHQFNQVPRPLCDIVDIVSGFGFPKDMQGKLEGELPFFKVGDISSAWKNGQRKLRQAQHYIDSSEAKAIKARPFPKGTVVFAKIGEAIKLNRRAILGQSSIVDNNVMGLIPRDGVADESYLFYWTLTLRLGDISQATTVPSVRKSDVEQLSFPWVPIGQQKRIVAEIEKQFSRLDEAVANLKRVKANLKRYKAAVLKAAVEGRLVETEAELAAQGCANAAGGRTPGAAARREDRLMGDGFASDGSVRSDLSDEMERKPIGRAYETGAQLLQRILATRRSQWQGKGKYKEPAAPDTAGLPELPVGWVWASVGSLLLNIEAGKSFKCEERPPTEGEVGVVKVSAVTWGEFDENESKTCHEKRLVNEKYLIRPGDFLFSRANTIELVGACVIAKKVTSSLMLSDKILRLRLLGGLEKWVLYNLRSIFGRGEIERLATGNQESMRNIGQERIRAIRIPLPPNDECGRIVAEIDRRLSLTREVEAQVDANLQRAERLRQAVLSQAFSGGLCRECAP